MASRLHRWFVRPIPHPCPRLQGLVAFLLVAVGAPILVVATLMESHGFEVVAALVLISGFSLFVLLLAFATRYSMAGLLVAGAFGGGFGAISEQVSPPVHMVMVWLMLAAAGFGTVLYIVGIVVAVVVKARAPDGSQT